MSASFLFPISLSPSNLRSILLASSMLIPPGAAMAQPLPNARPQGGQVVAGSATIGGDASRTLIQQFTDRAAINWQSFDIGQNQIVQFEQPSATSVILNRVMTPDPSQIAGQIVANGQVAIVNQSGVVFHQGSTVNAAGLVVSTANITNEAFMRGGRMHFDQPGQPDARIENNGTITVREAGLAALVAPQVANHGVIRARLGRVVLAGAETSIVDLHGDGLLSLEVASPVRQAPANGEALVTNTGTISATGGTALLTASAVDGIVQDLVQVRGRVAANTDAASKRTGRVVVAGTGGAVRIEGAVSAQGRRTGTKGGSIQILGDRTLVDSTARVDASGRAGGGTVAIGATAPRDTTGLARRTGIAEGAVVRADATELGNGGTVVVNSADYTVHAGTISARGAGQGGNGGFVEVSGQQGLAIMGGVDVGSGPSGSGGTFLIDPTTITIVADGDPDTNTSVSDFTGAILGSASPPPMSFIAAGIVNDPVFNNSTIELQATQTITVNAAINRTAIGGLTLTAGTNIVVNAPITIANGDLVMTGQNIAISGALLTQNGGISLATTSSLGTLRINSDVIALGGDINLTAASFTATPSILLGAQVRVDDDHTITTRGNIATSNSSGRFVGGALDVTLSGSDTELLNDNQIQVLRGMDSAGANRFRNIGSLEVTGNIGDSSNSYASIDVVGGDLTISGRVKGGGGLGNVDGVAAQLRASNDIIINGEIAAPTTRIQAGYNFTTNALDPTAAGGVKLAGTVSGFSGGNATSIELAAGTSGIVQTGGQILADHLHVATTGNALLTGASAGQANSIANLDSVEGDLTLDNGVSDLTIDISGSGVSPRSLAIRTAGEVAVVSPLVVTDRASFRVGSLRLASSGPGLPASITASLIEIAPLASGDMAINVDTGAQTFLLSGATLAGLNADTLRLGATTFNGVTTTSATGISFPTGLTYAGTVDLQAAGDVSQLAGTVLSFGGLSGRVGGGIVLDQANSLPRIGDLSGDGAVVLRTTGPQVLTGTISGASVSLSAASLAHAHGHSITAQTGNLDIKGDIVELNGNLAAASDINIRADTSASLAGTAAGAILTISSPSVTFGGMNAESVPVQLFLGQNGMASGTLDAGALTVFGGAGAHLFGSIAGIFDGSAASAGQRGTADGTMLAEPLPNSTAYLFNDCEIGAGNCSSVSPSPPQSFDAPLVSPLAQVAVLEPTPTMMELLRQPTLELTCELLRSITRDCVP